MPTKPELRRQIKELLAAQSAEARATKSAVIAEKLFREPRFQSAKTVLFFAATSLEVDTHPMIEHALKAGKKVVLPFSRMESLELELYEIKDFEGLKQSAYGILEPVPGLHARIDPSLIDFVVMPGVAFDKTGNRLGNGKGFYDRFLEKISPKVPKVALGFSFQMIDRVPAEAWDIRVEKVLTD